MLRRLQLSGNMLKLIAAVSMLLDHAGVILFPRIAFLRVLGRLAFPIFAFMIAEGCRHTKSRAKYFFTVFFMAALCQGVYYLFDGSLYMSVLVTFSLGMLIIFSMQYAKEICFSGAALAKKVISVLPILVSVVITYLLNRVLTIDYGFWGCMLPVFPALLFPPKENAPHWWSDPACTASRVLLLGVGLLILSMDIGGIQLYSLASLPLLLLYSGKRGKRKMKYFFYVFYPAHLALLEGLYLLVQTIAD